MNNLIAWLMFQIFGKRKMHNLNKNQKRILREMMTQPKGSPAALDYTDPDVKELVRFGILGRTT